MTKKRALSINAVEAKEAMDLASRDCEALCKLTLLLENIGIAKDKDLLHSSDLWAFNFLRELHHLQHIRPDLYRPIQKTIDDIRKKGPRTCK